MKNRPFLDEKIKPTKDSLKEVLKETFKHYNAICQMTATFKHEWNYSKGSGWMEKVSSPKKALFYVIPLVESIKISMAIREEEINQFKSDREMDIFKDDLEHAKKFTEGYQLIFTVEDDKSFSKFHDFALKLIGIRT